MRRLGGELAGAHDEHREVGVVDDVDAQPLTRFGAADVGRQAADLGLGLNLAPPRLAALLELAPFALPPQRLSRAARRVPRDLPLLVLLLPVRQYVFFVSIFSF